MPDDHRSFSLNPVSQTRPAQPARSMAVLILLALMLTGLSGCKPEVQKLKEQFTTTLDPNVRLTCLADLLKLPGQETTVRELFHSLNQEDELAVVKSSKPQDAAQELVPVIKVLYADLPNDQDGNDLLRAMNTPLRDLDDLTARSLSTEIDRWLEGRASFTNAKYDSAVAAYTRAIEVNGRNPGTFHDRALAYARLSKPMSALDDLTEIIRLNSNSDWKSRVQKALSSDQGLYNALWNEKDKYPSLVEIVPTPTQTPLPTMTSTPSRTPTPTPTFTPTPVPPTSTNTPTPTVTPTATATPIPIRAVSPKWSDTCRNPIAFRWTGTLQWYQIYRVIARYKLNETYTANLLTSERLWGPVWQAQLPARITLGGESQVVFGEIKWQVLINDTRTGETVNRSEWFKFYFDPLNGRPCP